MNENRRNTPSSDTLSSDDSTKVALDASQVRWDNETGLVPAIVQSVTSQEVLMLAYMNQEALAETLRLGQVTFFSRSRQRLWTKGETSGNSLLLESIALDCDGDTLLVQARATGPACHRGTRTCFSDETGMETSSPSPVAPVGVIEELDRLIQSREGGDAESSYTASLLASELHRVAQKVGEEAVEVILAATSRDDDGLIDETADLVYHLLVLLRKRGRSWRDITDRLRSRRDGALD